MSQGTMTSQSSTAAHDASTGGASGSPAVPGSSTGSTAAPAAAGQPIVQCAGLTKVFRDFWMRNRVMAVSSLDLRIEPGEVFGLLGPNGSGKSTTIKLLLGLLHPTAGRIAVFGKPPQDVSTKRRIGYLPEESYLYRFLNARETLDYYGRLFQISAPQRRQRIDMLMSMVGLEAVQDRPVREYSKGMQRRIGLAQALINDPQLLILDEPTSGLDPIGTRQIKDLILELKRRGKTVLLSSHLLADVEDVCDRVAIMYGGKVRAQGTVQELLELEKLTTIQTDELDEQTITEVEQVLARHGRHIEKVERPRQKLESLFLDIVHRAQASGVGTSGAKAGGQVAQFLTGDADTRSAHMPESVKAQQVIARLTGEQDAQQTPASTGQRTDPRSDASLQSDGRAGGPAAAQSTDQAAAGESAQPGISQLAGPSRSQDGSQGSSPDGAHAGSSRAAKVIESLQAQPQMPGQQGADSQPDSASPATFAETDGTDAATRGADATQPGKDADRAGATAGPAASIIDKLVQADAASSSPPHPSSSAASTPETPPETPPESAPEPSSGRSLDSDSASSPESSVESPPQVSRDQGGPELPADASSRMSPQTSPRTSTSSSTPKGPSDEPGGSRAPEARQPTDSSGANDSSSDLQPPRTAAPRDERANAALLKQLTDPDNPAPQVSQHESQAAADDEIEQQARLSEPERDQIDQASSHWFAQEEAEQDGRGQGHGAADRTDGAGDDGERPDSAFLEALGEFPPFEEDGHSESDSGKDKGKG